MFGVRCKPYGQGGKAELIYALNYAIIGLLGSSMGSGLMRWLSRRLRSRTR